MTTDKGPSHLPTVLCVDDEPHVLTSLERVLRRHGCRVLLADNGSNALDLLRAEQVEVLICDETMPGLRGTNVLCEAKRIAPNTRRILLTAHCSDQAVVVPAVNVGEVFRLIPKPWSDDELKRAVNDALGSKPAAWSNKRARLEQRLRDCGATAGAAACAAAVAPDGKLDAADAAIT